MWISFNNVAELFDISQETVVGLRERVAKLEAENSALKADVTSTKINLDWLRVQYNQVQAERTQLMNTRYGLHVATPQLQPSPGAYFPTLAAQEAISSQVPKFEDLSFEDIGDEAARKLGLPVYGE